MAREHEVGIEVSVDQVRQKRRCIIYHFYKLIYVIYMFCVFMILRERARKAYYRGKRNGDDNGS